MTSTRFCICAEPSIEAADGERVCGDCGELENPMVPALGRALAGPLSELRDRIAALEATLRDERAEPAVLVDAAEISRLLGVTRAWIYAHARELGGVQLGSGPRPRWAFDPALVRARLDHRGGSPGAPAPHPPKPARRLPPAELLPVKDRTA